MPEPVDLVIHGRIFFDISICRRHVSLRLVVIVVRDEIFHGVFREEFLELAVQLRSQRFIMRDDQRRLVQLLDHVGHGKRFAGARHAEQRFKLVAFFEAIHQFFDRLRLIARRLIFGY